MRQYDSVEIYVSLCVYACVGRVEQYTIAQTHILSLVSHTVQDSSSWRQEWSQQTNQNYSQVHIFEPARIEQLLSSEWVEDENVNAEYMTKPPNN